VSEITRATPHAELPEFLTVEQFAVVAGIGRDLAYQLVKRGEVPSRRFGRLIRIPKSALLADSPAPAVKLRRA
jgi:excisionase family DNA binding protein